MEIIFIVIWIILAVLIASAASARGRDGLGWFLLSVCLSPLIAIALLLVFPNLKQQELLEKAAGQQRLAPAEPRAPIPMTRGHFEPDGVHAGVPYRIQPDGAVLAIMQGSEVRFTSFTRFTEVLGRQS